MAEENFQERTEKATGRRRQKAREEGKVAKSMELNSAIILCLGFLSLYLIGPSLADQTMNMLRHTFSNAPVIAASDPTFVSVFNNAMYKYFMILLPIFGILFVIAFGSNAAQVGFKVSTKVLEPKFEKLDLVSGLKRMFSLKSLVQLFRDSAKLFIVGFVAYKVIASEFDSFFMLPDMSVVQFASFLGKTAFFMVLKISGVIFALAILDYIYQKYEFEKSIRMSKQDMKDEYKDTEGSPQLKSRIRQVQRQMAQNRMMKAVPTADVVVTNPTHLAVAIKYDPDQMDAPTIIAKGERLIAQKIKEVAREAGVPVIEDKPLARALFKMCSIGDLVPSKLFRAVAEVLAYVYKQKGKVLG